MQLYRATALKTKTAKHVCGGKLFDAVMIDARRRKDDVPWDETGKVLAMLSKKNY
jgi:hypothetical protein